MCVSNISQLCTLPFISRQVGLFMVHAQCMSDEGKNHSLCKYVNTNNVSMYTNIFCVNVALAHLSTQRGDRVTIKCLHYKNVMLLLLS